MKNREVNLEFASVLPSASERRTMLAPHEVARGLLAMHRNGRRLFSDAVLLFEQERFPSAVLLAVLAQEEFGKALGLGLYAVIDHDGGLRKLWVKQFANHEAKGGMSLVAGIVTGLLDVQEGKTFEDGARQLVTIRERSAYVDCVQGAEEWSLPTAVFGQPLAKQVLAASFAAIRKCPNPSQAVGHMAQVWAKALEGKAARTPAEEAELLRARSAALWAESDAAKEYNRVDSEEGTRWNREMLSRLGDLRAGPSSAEA